MFNFKRDKVQNIIVKHILQNFACGACHSEKLSSHFLTFISNKVRNTQGDATFTTQWDTFSRYLTSTLIKLVFIVIVFTYIYSDQHDTIFIFV